MFKKINDKIIFISTKFKFFLEEIFKSKKCAIIILILVLTVISLLSYISMYVLVNKGIIQEEKEDISNPVFSRIDKKNIRYWSPNK